MEVEETSPDPDYVQGFNEGYLISKEMPELSEPLAKAMGDSNRADGFRDGKKQLESELQKGKDKGKEIDNTPKWLKTDRLKTMDKGDGRTKDKGRDKEER